MCGLINLHLEVAPKGERADLYEPVRFIPLHYRHLRASDGVHASRTGDPRVVTLERAREGIHFPHEAAQVWIPSEQVLAKLRVLLGDRLARHHVDDRDGE